MKQQRAAIYIRMSTAKQEDSPERQRSQVEPYAQRQGYEVVATYEDLGIAGDEFDRRPSVLRMIADARAGRFDVIVADELTRISRQETVAFIAKVVYPLREAGVRIDTVADGPLGWDDAVQIIMLTLKQDKSSSESPGLARRVMSKHLLLADRRVYLGGLPPYGYCLTDDAERGKKLVPDPRKAKHVVLMFRLIDQGHTLASLRDELYARGVPSPSGKDRWSRNTILSILKNRKYLGDYVWGENATGKHTRQSNGQVRKRRPGESRFALNPESEWIIRNDSHDPLIDRDQYERVQGRLQANRSRKTPHPGGGSFVLTRLLVCSDCGARMIGTTTDAGHRIYRCGTNMAYGKDACFKNSVREAPLVRLLVSRLQSEFLSQENLQKLREAARKHYESQSNPSRLATLQGTIADLTRKIDSGNERLATLPADRVPGIVAKLRQWERERDASAMDLANARSTAVLEQLEEDIAAVEQVLWQLRDALEAEDAMLLRQIFRELICRVELEFSHRATAKTTRSKLVRGTVYIGEQSAGSLSLFTSARTVAEAPESGKDLPPPQGQSSSPFPANRGFWAAPRRAHPAGWASAAAQNE